VTLADPRRAEDRDAVVDVAQGIEAALDLVVNAAEPQIVLLLDVAGRAQQQLVALPRVDVGTLADVCSGHRLQRRHRFTTNGGKAMSRLGERAGRCRTTIGSLALLAALLLVLPAAASACIEDGGGEDRAPAIGGEQVNPATLTYLGGTVVLRGEVEDDCGIRSVHGEVLNEGFASFFEMHPVGPGSFVNATLYQGEAQLPPNDQESPVYYSAVMEAEDTNGSIEHAFSGEIEVAAAPAFDEAPYVSNATLSPRTLGSAGGLVTIGADATDNRSVASVFAIVTLPDKSQREVPLEPTSSQHFEGTFLAPANFGAAPEEYSVVVYAEDDIGQTGSESASGFTVVPPPSGELIVRGPTTKSFGRVKVGHTSTRRVMVRNTGRRGTAPVAASIVTSGAPFSIQGAAGGKVEFVLEPKETRAFTIEFEPVAAGPVTGSAVVVRADGARPSASVSLTGVGAESRGRLPTKTR
jgi:hypothetical protein